MEHEMTNAMNRFLLWWSLDMYAHLRAVPQLVHKNYGFIHYVYKTTTFL